MPEFPIYCTSRKHRNNNQNKGGKRLACKVGTIEPHSDYDCPHDKHREQNREL